MATETEPPHGPEILDRITDAFFALDAEWRFTYANEEAERLLNRSADELLGENVWEAFEEAVDTAFHEQFHRAVETGEPVTFEEHYPPLRTWFEVTVYPGDDGLSVCLRDITDRKVRERELERTKERFRRMFEHSHDAIFINDPRNDEIVAANPAGCEMLGYTRKELLSLGPSDCHPDEKDRFEAFVEEVFDEGAEWTDELTCRTRDGRDLPVEISASRIDIDGRPHMLAIVRDVSDRRDRERELERQRDALSTLNEVNALVQGVTQGLVEAESRRTAERAVCERAVASRPYAAAWIGEPAGDWLAVRAHDGDPDALAGASGGRARDLAAAAVEHDEVRLDATDGDALAAVPLTHDGSAYGVLGLAASRPAAFDYTERSLLAELGDTVAYALDAAEHRERYRSVVGEVLDETADVGVVILDDDYEVAWVNETFGEYLGVDPADFIGRDKRRLVAQRLKHAFESPAAFEAAVTEAYSEDAGALTFECHVTAAEGREERYLEHRSRPIESGLYAGGRVELYYDVTGRKERERELRRERDTTERIFEASPIGIAVVAADGEVVRANRRAAELLELSAAGRDVFREATDVYDADGEPFPDDRLYRRVLDEGETVTDVEVAVGEPPDRHWMSLNLAPVAGGDGEVQQVVVTGRDVTERKERERTLARQRDELEQLARINDAVRGIDRALVRATTRREIAEAVPERLTEIDPYCGAWFGTVDTADRTVVPEAWVGIDDDTFGDAEFPYTEEGSAAGVAGTAIRTGTVRTANADDPLLESWTGWLSERGVESVAAVPVTYEGSVYAVVGIHADRRDAFPEREREVLAELGEGIGHAITAIERKEALVSDRVVEVELVSRDAADVFADLDEDLTLEFHRTVATSDGAYLLYLTVRGVAPDRFREELSGSGPVERVRRISRTDDGTLFELRASEAPLASTLATHGGNVRTMVVEDGAVRAVAELPYGADVRSVIERVRRTYPDIDLVSQQTRDTDARSAGEYRGRVTDRLTDRQQEALAAAYFAGYFEWSRESTGEDVADAMGVSSATFHQHLRAGQRKLLAELFEPDRR